MEPLPCCTQDQLSPRCWRWACAWLDPNPELSCASRMVFGPGTSVSTSLFWCETLHFPKEQASFSSASAAYDICISVFKVLRCPSQLITSSQLGNLWPEIGRFWNGTPQENLKQKLRHKKQSTWQILYCIFTPEEENACAQKGGTRGTNHCLFRGTQCLKRQPDRWETHLYPPQKVASARWQQKRDL